MTDHQANQPEGQSTNQQQPSSRLNQGQPEVPKAEDGEQKTAGNGNDSPQSERKSFFWLSIVFDALLFIVTSVYAFFAFHQWQAMNRQADVAATQSVVMAKQLEAMNSSSAQTERLIKANEELAKLNGDLVRNSSEQVKASVAQSEATKAQAQIAQQSFYIGDRPYLSANAVLDKLEPGIAPIIELVFENNGKTPALNFQVGAMVDVGNSPKPDLKRAVTTEAIAENMKQLPYSNLAPEGNTSFLTAGGKSVMQIRGPEVTPNLIDDVKSQRRFMFVWGVALYKDGLSKRHSIKFCFFYNATDNVFVGCPTFNSTN